jgi:hypothetical protein
VGWFVAIVLLVGLALAGQLRQQAEIAHNAPALATAKQEYEWAQADRTSNRIRQ